MVNKGKALKPRSRGNTGGKGSTQQNTSNKQRKMDTKEAWLDELGLSLAKLGLRINPVAADGNCFFRACCDQKQGNEGDHMTLRKQVVGFLRDHPDDFAPYMEDEEDFDSYCNRMEQEGTWAGQHEQVALARLCGVQLRIYQAGQPCWTLCPNFPEIPKDNAPCWHLSYHQGEHYNSVRQAHDLRSEAPAPILVLGSNAKVKDNGGWDEQQIRLVSQGTGCEDTAAIRSALAEASGCVNQAIELLIEGMAAESEQDPEKEDLQASVNSTPGCGQPNSPGSVQAQQQAEAGPEPDASGQASPGQQNTSYHMKKKEDPSAASGRRLGRLKVAGLGALAGDSRPKPPRNRPCTCGSGRRYKNCCGAVRAAAARCEKGFSEAQEDSSSVPVQIESLYL